MKFMKEWISHSRFADMRAPICLSTALPGVENITKSQASASSRAGIASGSGFHVVNVLLNFEARASIDSGDGPLGIVDDGWSQLLKMMVTNGFEMVRMLNVKDQR